MSINVVLTLSPVRFRDLKDTRDGLNHAKSSKTALLFFCAHQVINLLRYNSRFYCNLIKK